MSIRAVLPNDMASYINRVTMAFVRLPGTMENNEKMREKQVA